MQKFKVPTGYIAIIKGERNLPLEFLSIGDYGKDKNIKADFLGYTKKINGVPDSDIMPLEEKMVITISSQYGCSMKCNFCDVPLVGPGINATLADLRRMVIEGIGLYPSVAKTKRLNIHYARMGEPTFNWDVLLHAEDYLLNDVKTSGFLARTIHPVVSTMLPKINKELKDYLKYWMWIKNHIYKGEAGLQLIINSTSEKQRDRMFGGSSLSLSNISRLCEELPNPVGRKITLNFAISDHTEIDGVLLANFFDTTKFMCKITPIHETVSAKKNNVFTSEGYDNYYPYEKAEYTLKEAGFDVLVFIPSHKEDESKITCGNAILAKH